MNPAKVVVDTLLETTPAKRRRLVHGDVFDHPRLGRLVVRVTPLACEPPRSRWEVYNSKGELAAATDYSEVALQRTLRWYGKFLRPYTFVTEPDLK